MRMKEKKNLILLFGGQSSEHDVSCVSAVTVAGGVDRQKYDLLLIGITKDGRWLKTDSIDDVASGKWRESTVRAALLPDAGLKSVLIDDNGVLSLVRADVVFPVLHGLYGEDGCVQGLLELAQIPYVGCGVLSSAVTMDKATTKAIVDRLGVAQAKYLAFRREEMADLEGLCDRIETALGWPVFVKSSGGHPATFSGFASLSNWKSSGCAQASLESGDT